MMLYISRNVLELSTGLSTELYTGNATTEKGLYPNTDNILVHILMVFLHEANVLWFLTTFDT